MKQQRRADLYLLDMITSIERIIQYTQGLHFESFQKNFLVVDAVARNFEIIGEAARKIPMDLQKRHPEVPWDKMYRLRNIVSHAYFQVDHETLWKIITKDLSKNGNDLKEILKKEFPQ